MRPWIRILMLWIMIVSLPMRGIAGAVTYSCAMTHASMANRAVASLQDCDDPEMTMPMVQPHARVHAGADIAHRDKPCDQGSCQKHSSCRACPACHVGAAAPPSIAIVEVPAASLANRSISPAPFFTGWIPSGLDRPPRP